MSRNTIYQLAIFALLLAIWLVLSGQFDLFHLTLGALSCLLVMRFSSDLLFLDRSQSAEMRFREAIQLPSYIAWLFGQITLANLHVLRLSLHPRGLQEVQPRMVRFETGLKTEFARWVLANSITLTPGTVTVKVEGDEFWVHAISAEAARGLPSECDEMEARIKQIFEPEDEAS